MKALTEGRYRSRDGNAVLFDVGHCAAALATIRVSILERDIGRVTLKRPEGYRLDRGWAIAPNELEPPFAGRPRDDVSGFANPPVAVTEEQRHCDPVHRGAGRGGDLIALRDRLASSRGGGAVPGRPAHAGLFYFAQDRRTGACDDPACRGPALWTGRQGGPTRSHWPTLHHRRGRSVRVRR